MKLLSGLILLVFLIFLKFEKPAEVYNKDFILKSEIPLKVLHSAAALPRPTVVSDIENIDSELSQFSKLDFVQFSDLQLAQYNSLLRKRAELLKDRIFKKYFSKYGRAEI